jgi:hypothetical protein
VRRSDLALPTPSANDNAIPRDARAWKERQRRKPIPDDQFCDLFPVGGDFCGTLTFKHVISDSQAMWIFRNWLSALSREFGTHITVAAGIERRTGNAPHFHVALHLPENPRRFDRDRALALWQKGHKRAGRTNELEPFDHGGGAGSYLAKDGRWGILVACPRDAACRRKKGCRATSPTPQLKSPAAPLAAGCAGSSCAR